MNYDHDVHDDHQHDDNDDDHDGDLLTCVIFQLFKTCLHNRSANPRTNVEFSTIEVAGGEFVGLGVIRVLLGL